MSSAEWEDDDPFEEQRDKIENPMKRLFLAYGRDYLPQVSVGIFASVFARLLDLLPPLMLGSPSTPCSTRTRCSASRSRS